MADKNLGCWETFSRSYKPLRHLRALESPHVTLNRENVSELKSRRDCLHQVSSTSGRSVDEYLEKPLESSVRTVFTDPGFDALRPRLNGHFTSSSLQTLYVLVFTVPLHPRFHRRFTSSSSHLYRLLVCQEPDNIRVLKCIVGTTSGQMLNRF
ncbi:hypothetical protein RRG08_066213 [Elysia crispata]|uniref:Uncharacterized protein n=1 Tax=Elysia crispata TaxID=231223 RepID=A0AAE1BD66_9GAST|nr:hypothetical protein RRG08_066213 [Elysia crispata]